MSRGRRSSSSGRIPSYLLEDMTGMSNRVFYRMNRVSDPELRECMASL